MTISAPGNYKLTPEVKYGALGQVIYLEPIVNMVKVTPTSPTVTILKPGGAATTIVNAVCTIDSDGNLAYALDATDTAAWIFGMDYLADFKFTVAGRIEYVSTVFDIVMRPLGRYCPLAINDLKGADPRIDSYFSNNTDFQSNVPNMAITRAWEDIYQWMRSRDATRRPYLVADPRVLYSATRYMALAKLAGMLKEVNVNFVEVEKGFLDDAAKAKATTEFKYSDEATRAVTTARALQQPELFTGPDRTRDGPLDERFWGRVAGIIK